MKNKYMKHAHISERQFRKILRLFCEDNTALSISNLTNIHRNTADRVIQLLREDTYVYRRRVVF
jgi:transcription initiation factor IIE alpha subunit